MVRKIINIVTTVILVLLISLVVILFIVRMTGKTPSFFGYHVYRVQTDSMAPTLNVGDVILGKDVSVEDIHEGDIITYRCLSGKLEGQTITHRVIVPPTERDGKYYLQTKGDREGAEPDDEITYDQVEGKYIKKIAWIDKLYTFFLSPGGLITFIGIIVVLFAYELISLIVNYKRIDEPDDDYYEPKPKKESKKRKKRKKS